jgi:hypothetical protein
MQAISHLQPQNHYLHRLIINLQRLLYAVGGKPARFVCINTQCPAAGFGEYFSRFFSFQESPFSSSTPNFNEDDFYFNPKAIAKLSLNKIGSGLNGVSKYLTLMQQINNI